MNYGFFRFPKCASKFDFSGAAASATGERLAQEGLTVFFAGIPLLVQFFLAFVILLGLFSVTAWAVRSLGGRGLPRLAVIEYAGVGDSFSCGATTSSTCGGSRSLVLIPIIECRSSVVTLGQVYDAIGQFPDGLTSKQIADFLGKSANQVSGLASKLFYYGKVDREFAPGYRGIYRYNPKTEVGRIRKP
jgi:hypothetical protein